MMKPMTNAVRALAHVNSALEIAIRDAGIGMLYAGPMGEIREHLEAAQDYLNSDDAPPASEPRRERRVGEADRGTPEADNGQR